MYILIMYQSLLHRCLGFRLWPPKCCILGQDFFAGWLPKICFRKEGNAYNAVLIDLEHCKSGIWDGPSSSCIRMNLA